MKLEIPPAILASILEGRAILFLGAAASYDALVDGLPKKITSDLLRNLLSDKFLGGAYKAKPLQAVADFARNEGSLLEVQTEVRNLFTPLEPNDFHKLLPTFRWKAIVTTNYDLVVERAYQVKGALQELAPVTKDGDALESALRGQNTVPYLKLHGCINNYADTNVPMVLDSREYLKFSHGRSNLVSTFREWAINSPVIFCGYSLSDENIKQILFDIGDESQSRPQYMYIAPDLELIEIRYWQQKRMVALPSTFKNFMVELDVLLPAGTRKLASLIGQSTNSFAKWIPSHQTPSDGLAQYLASEVFHVLAEAPSSDAPDPRAFFSGLDTTFTPIYAGLDVRRQVVNDLLNRVVLDTLKSTLPKVFVLRGYAGCGKTVLTRRLAVETAQLLDNPLVVYISARSVIRTDLLLELQKLVQDRLYVFLDDLMEYGDDLLLFLQRIQKAQVPITVFANGRTNEMNVYGKDIAPYVSGEFEIGDLESDEVGDLLKRLADLKLLGPLQSYDEADRRLFLEKFYNRQLLVALHEITRGDSFEVIIVDEFEKVTPRAAQQMYLDICTLHQCRVTVRAGLISRLSGIPIRGLKEFLAGSLARVVVAEYDYRIRDYVYRSRHEEISRMVFELGVTSPQSRSVQLQRILSTMDLDYTSDNKAFFELLKGRRLAELFEDKRLAVDVFDAAMGADPPPSYLNHQRAILELNHKSGNLEAANQFLTKAEIQVREEGYSPASIQHTKANLLRRRALLSERTVERDRYRADARAILKGQLFRRDGSYTETLYSRLLLDEVKDLFAREEALRPDDLAQAEATVRTVNELKDLIDEYLRQHPSDPQMILVKVEFLETLGKSPAAVQLLEGYCNKNTTSGPVHRVLAETLVTLGRLDEAETLLRVAVVTTPGDKDLNFSLARLLIRKSEDANGEAILLHLRRSFTDGDANYEARFYYARCHMLYGDLSKGEAEFVALRRPYIQSRDRVHGLVRNSDRSKRRYAGKILSKQAGYGFVICPDLRFNVFLSKSSLPRETWDDLGKGVQVHFHLGFTFRGPVAADLEIQRIKGN